ncbi:MAG: NFACT family protein [Clostridiales bacterium]|jgi:predicted ribosome quality control (RQC) complex YloA/Tae2 family protein|nr:NFACT family protein [Clostridiales bacterium]
MAFDTFVLAAVCQELQEKILGARIIKIHQPDRHTVICKYHQPGDTGRLLLSANPRRAAVYLSETKQDNPDKAPLFCMVLRKYLEGAKISGIEQIPHDRILRISCSYRNDLGDISTCCLIIEIMGKHSNIILINQDDLIIDGIHRYSHAVSRHREILPGQPYLAPPAQNKADPRSLNDEEDIADLLLELPLEISISEALAGCLEGLSPFLARELVLRADLSPQMPLNYLDSYQFRRLFIAVQEFYRLLDHGPFQPVLADNKDFAAFPLLSFPKQQQKQFISMSQALEYFYQKQREDELFAGRKRELSKIITGNLNRMEKKIAIQETDLDKAEAAQAYKKAGDLLSTHLYQLRDQAKGQDKVVLPDFFQDGKAIEISLDPAKSPEENIKRYYHRYSKAKKAQGSIIRQLETNRDELAYLQAVLINTEHAETLADLLEIKQELAQSGYLRQDKKPVSKPEESLPPLSFVSQDGYTILVGRNNRQNDKLTLKIADKKDIWLHAQKIPGSHTIIVSNGRIIPRSTINEAASIAAWFSKARGSSKVPVDFTMADQVKKPNGAKPGMVVYYQQNTVYVTPILPSAGQ